MNLTTERRHSRGRGTRAAVGKDAKLLESSSWSGTAQPSPSLIVEFDQADVIRELNELSMLEADWDEEDALAIDPDAVACAKALVSQVAQSVIVHTYMWQRPSVGPLRSGGIALSWHLADHHLLLIVEPDTQGIVYVKTEREVKPIRRLVSWRGAIDRILVSLSNQ